MARCGPEDHVIFAKRLKPGRDVNAPAENGIGFRIGTRCNECRNRTEYSRHLEVPTLKFLSQAHGAVGTRSVRLRSEFFRLEDNVGAWFFYCEVKGRTLA